MANTFVLRHLTIHVPLTIGVCRWCRCTDHRACASGCSWVERSQTLCSECVPLDKALQNNAGRRELAEFVQEHGFLVGRQMPAKARARR